MTAQARRLHVVDSETHEILEEHPEVTRLQDEVKGLTRALRKECREHEELKRDKEAEAREHQLWPKAMSIFGAWKTATGHTRSEWDGTRFWMIEPYLRNSKYGVDVCLRAVAGIAYDHFSVKRKNGTIRHFDEWHRIFLSADALEERASAAPKGWREDPVYAEVLERWAK